MSDPNWLLSTLAQSTAAIVAIVGGFLVSRLVQLSSEKEGLRRRLTNARDEQKHVAQLFEVAHEYRLENSREAFFGWVLDDLVKRDEDFDPQALLEKNIPRGSSLNEMAEYLDEIIPRVDAALANVGAYLSPSDTRDVTIEDLEARGMKVPPEDREIYDNIEYNVLDDLPERTYDAGPHGLLINPVPHLRVPLMESPAITTTELRRLDDSIREEQELLSRRSMLEAEIARLAAAIEQIGKPVAVTPAVWILGIYSVLGIVAPVAVMAFFPLTIDAWLAWALVGMFVVGLALVVIYIYWYARSLNAGASKQPVGGEK
ncbi:hypothetical protein H4J02_06635 [Protaetiibacter sp. SSC-01]|uniref:hypothetical protein n=1 Tax=Protaetiibacter sp. SSC-01 TaxID=2759943 RepID=UPI001656ADDB|nr:hypothetical protein [Protaetiibacter sp. SSC-01]QNO38662.1 hypothetical protein H4J02_06635 [Protaetiibacter sp. SSC-01]